MPRPARHPIALDPASPYVLGGRTGAAVAEILHACAFAAVVSETYAHDILHQPRIVRGDSRPPLTITSDQATPCLALRRLKGDGDLLLGLNRGREYRRVISKSFRKFDELSANLAFVSAPDDDVGYERYGPCRGDAASI